VADEDQWIKSSYSDQQGGACVEAAGLTGHVGVRDSKNKSGPAFVVSNPTWNAFLVGFTRPGQDGQVDPKI